MALLSDVIRSGIRGEDLTDLPEEVRKGLEPLLKFLNTSIQGLAAALGKNVSLTDNMRTEVQTVNLDHGVAQFVSLKKLPQAKGVRGISVGSADGKTQHMLARPLQLIGTTAPNQVKVLAYFADSTALRVPVTLELTPEGNYTALTPSDGTWTTATLANSWVAFGAPAFTPGYLKDASGFVHLRGGIKNGTINAAAFTLPAGSRPTADCYFVVRSFNGVPSDIYAVVHVSSAGVVTAGENITGANNFMSLDGITFDTR